MNSPQRPNANTLVFVPCFNEAENVTPLIAKISEVAPTADILFCDDNSPDGTGEVLQGLQSQYPRLQLMRRAGKLGVGSAHLDGIRYALAHGYTHLVTMDCDFTHSPEDIPRLLDAAKDADIVVGSRFLSEDSLPGWTAYRRTMTRVGHQVTSTLLGIPNDATTAFRVYRLDRINPRLFDHFTERGYAFFLHSLHHAIRHGYQIVDVSIVLPARTYGHSKMSVREIARSVQQIAALAGQRTVDPQALPLSRTDEGDPQNGSEWDAYWEAAKAPTLAYSVAAPASSARSTSPASPADQCGSLRDLSAQRALPRPSHRDLWRLADRRLRRRRRRRAGRICRCWACGERGRRQPREGGRAPR